MAWQTVTEEQIRRYRLTAHHLCGDAAVSLTEAAASGLQNSPPGAWETALFNRVEGCALAALQNALYREKTLLQAWSRRGVPAIFPTAESDVFCRLSPRCRGKAGSIRRGWGWRWTIWGWTSTSCCPLCAGRRSLSTAAR